MSVPATKVREPKGTLLGRLGMGTAELDGYVIEGLRKLGVGALFLVRLMPRIPPALGRPRLIVQQIYNAGARSLIIIMLAGFFVGAVLALQGFNLLQRFGSQDALGIAAALGLLRELGPVVTALLFAGRAGTSLTSEIGLMRATDQLTAMQIMAVDPLRYVAAPRFLGGAIAMPFLAAIFDLVGLYGAHLVGVQQMGVDRGSYWSQLQNAVFLRDVWEGFVKSLVFGVVCSLVAVNEGYHAQPTAAGVGLATTRTVVTSSVLVLLFDYVLTAIYL
jgi:phospholipid/cholesterol/gamma-HCH transport system permease protein